MFTSEAPVPIAVAIELLTPVSVTKVSLEKRTRNLSRLKSRNLQHCSEKFRKRADDADGG